MPPRIKHAIVAIAALILCLPWRTPLAAQDSPPEFIISIAPSVATVTQGEVSSVTVMIACNTASMTAVADCNERPKFDFQFSKMPAGVQVEVATGRVGVNTVTMLAAPEAGVGAFPIQVTVMAGDTVQTQTFTLNVRPARPPAVVVPVIVPPTRAVHWEHRLIIAKTPEELDLQAKELGKDSWELVSVTTRRNRGVDQWVGFFKRARAT